MSTSILDKVEALFDDEKYVEARTEAEAALKNPADNNLDEASQKRLKLLIRKCNLHAPPQEQEEKQQQNATATASPAAPQQEQKQKQEETSATTPAPAAPAPAPRPAPLARHEWYQTASTITFTFYVKERSQEHIKLEHTNRSLKVFINMPNNSDKVAEWIFDPFYMPIKNDEIKTNVTKFKVEVIVPKVDEGQWPSLELKAGNKAVSQPIDVLPKTAAELNYPNSSTKKTDWSKVALEEEEEKPEGDAALNGLFKKIYANADEDTRRAMIKSYQESGGTTLSTNWENVGKEYVKPEAPKGMEVKNWTDDGV